MLIMPVSSLTISTRASVFSLTPRPARWRVPKSRLMELLSLSVSTQAADTMRVPRIITAPSCSGVLGSKIFSSSGAEIRESISVPLDSVMSFKPVRCSNTISAPTRRRDRRSRHWVISSTTRWLSSRWVDRSSLAVRPICSRALRISGWNRIISAITPLFKMLRSSQFRVVSPSNSLA